MKKFAVLGLSLLLTVVAFCSCSKKETVETTTVLETEEIIIEEEVYEPIPDIPMWYTSRTYVYETEYASYPYDTVNNIVVSVDDAHVTSVVFGQKFNASNRNNPYEEMSYCHIVSIDPNGMSLFFADISEYSGIHNEENNSYSRTVLSATETEENVVVLYEYHNFTSNREGDFGYKLLTVDKASGEVVSDELLSDFNDCVGNGISIKEVVASGTNFIALVGKTNSQCSGDLENPEIYRININGRYASIDISNELSENNIDEISGLNKIDDTHFVLYGIDSEDEAKFLIFDSSDMSISLLDMDAATADMSIDISDYSYGFDGAVNSRFDFIKNEDSMFALNPDSLRYERLLDTTRCSYNYADYSELYTMVGRSRNKIYMALDSRESDGGLVIISFERHEENPFEDRTILTAARLNSEAQFEEAELIYRFNNSQEDYVIFVSNEYLGFETEADMLSSLKADISSSNGPDIILDSFMYLDIYSSNYLYDLSSLIEENGFLDNELYYANVFELLRSEDEAIYQFPLTIEPMGIVAPRSTVGSGHYGFTFSEYSHFVTYPMNGVDPMATTIGSDAMFSECFNNMLDLFIVDGVVDLDNDAFRNILEHAFLAADCEGDASAYYGSYLLGAASYMSSQSVYGIPSADGRGVQLCVKNSIAVNSNSSNLDGALSFVEFSFENNSQRLMGVRSIDRNIAMLGAMYCIEDANIEVERMMYQNPGFVAAHYTFEGTLAEYNRYSYIVEHASGFYQHDTEITAIIMEETAPYLCEERTIEEVIEIAEERIQEAIDNR